jgi:hypothetical protein|tara:strand:+ start:245 stop:508 length:264 start_codon:yes stop_codon:yes gene_type:complete
MSQKQLQKLQQMLKGKKKKPVVKTARTVALEGRKHFGHGGTNSMINQAQKDYNGSYFGGSSLGGVKVSNKSYDKYYGSQFIPKGFIK